MSRHSRANASGHPEAILARNLFAPSGLFLPRAFHETYTKLCGIQEKANTNRGKYNKLWWSLSGLF